MTTETDKYNSGPATKAINKNPNDKGGTVANGLSGKEDMYASRDMYVARNETPTDTPRMDVYPR